MFEQNLHVHLGQININNKLFLVTFLSLASLGYFKF